MINLSKKALSRGALLTGTSLVSALVALPADALQLIGTPTVTSVANVTANGGPACRIDYSLTIRGQTNDNNNFDLGLMVVNQQGSTTQTYSAARSISSPIQVTTNLVSPTAGLLTLPSVAPNSIPQPIYLSIYETTLSQQYGVLLGEGQLSASMLHAAGGTCGAYAPNAAPVSDAGADFVLAGGAQGSLIGSGTDADGDALTYTWTQISGAAATLVNAGMATASFTAPPRTNAPQTLVFQLAASDTIESGTDTVTVTLPANIAPVPAVAQSAITTGGGATVSLDASPSTDADGDTLSYTWTQIAGPNVTLNNANTAAPSFTAPVVGSNTLLTFSVSVSDGIASALATVDVTVFPNAPPVVNAGGDQTVSGGAIVELTGTATDPEFDPMTYQWVQTSGPAVTLSSAASLGTNFTAPPKTNAVQSLTFDFVANDGTSSASDSVNVDVIANIGTNAVATAPAQVVGGSIVTIDGSASADGDGDAVSFAWTQVSGTPVTLSGASTAQPTFVAPPRDSVSQPLVFQLQTDDGFGGTDTAQVTITVPANGVPVASAGPDQTVPGASLVTLDASATTDLENDPLTFAWTQTAGPAVTLSNAAAISPTFTAPAKLTSTQTLSFTLDVTDGIDSAAPDSVDIFIPANLPPSTDAGADFTASGGALVTLVGSGSADGDGDALTYAWTQTGGPLVTLSDTSAANPTFTAPIGGTSVQTFTFELTVSDGIVTAAADQVIVSINPNSPPVADAGIDIGPVDGGQTVTLTGAASSDIDNSALTYLWTQVSGTPVVLSDATAVAPTFSAPLVISDEDLVFQLIVNDGAANSLPDTVIVSVRSVGTVRIVQRIIGKDSDVSFTSDIASLSGSLTTQNGSAELVATSVPAGAYTITAADLTAAGYALTGIACSDSDSVVNLSTRSIDLALSSGEVLTCTFTSTDTRSAAVVAIESFLTGRNALLLANEPDTGRRIGRLMDGATGAGQVSVAGFAVPGTTALPLSLSFNDAGGNFSTSLSQMRAAAGGADPDRPELPLDFWTEVNFGTAKFGNQKHDYQLVYLGADYLLQPDILVGVMGTLDNISKRGGPTAGSAEGNGWMVGPYATTRLAPNLFGDVRAAWGRSDNTVSPLGTFTDDFTTDRALYSASMTGVFNVDASMQFRPEVSVRYISEDQKAYRDSLGVTIPGRTVDQGEFAFSPRLDKQFDLGDGWTLRPFIAANGIYAFGVAGAASLSDGLRARAEIGTSVFKRGGLRLDISATQDGIGASGHKTTGAIISLSKAF